MSTTHTHREIALPARGTTAWNDCMIFPVMSKRLRNPHDYLYNRGCLIKTWDDYITALTVLAYPDKFNVSADCFNHILSESEQYQYEHMRHDAPEDKVYAAWLRFKRWFA